MDKRITLVGLDGRSDLFQQVTDALGCTRSDSIRRIETDFYKAIDTDLHCVARQIILISGSQMLAPAGQTRPTSFSPFSAGRLLVRTLAIVGLEILNPCGLGRVQPECSAFAREPFSFFRIVVRPSGFD